MMADLINVDAIKDAALGRWDAILQAAGLAPAYLSKRHGACPVCMAGKDRYRFSNQGGRGTWICNKCRPEGADGFGLLMALNGWGFIEAARWVGQYLGIASGDMAAATGLDPAVIAKRQQQEAAERAQKWAKARADNVKLWRQAAPVAHGSIVAQYLCSRGLVLDVFPKALRFHPAVAYWQKDDDGKLAKLGEFPAMLAAVVNPEGVAVALHKTHLNPQGKKADVPCVKKWTGASGDVAGAVIRLFPAGESLALAEGIETALGVHLASGLPVWAGVSANGLAAAVLPDEVRAVYIFADNDENQAGQNAANALAQRLEAEGRTVRVLVPSIVGWDWLDVLNADAANDASASQPKAKGVA